MVLTTISEIAGPVKLARIPHGPGPGVVNCIHADIIRCSSGCFIQRFVVMQQGTAF